MAQPNWYRKCVGCRTARHKNELLRVVVFRDAPAEIDTDQRKPGRGAYVCPRIECIIAAQKRRGFERSFRAPLDADIYEKLIQQVSDSEY
ncbi:MAG TPA: YlxR family protein [bacterium]|nr:YlxR family protein [bacterium]